jgi:hypothetical protein
VATVKSDIQREMDASELSKVRQEVTEAARAFEQSVQQQTSAFESEVRAIEQGTAAPAVTNTIRIAAPAADDGVIAQAAMLAEQETGLPPATAPRVATTIVPVVQGSFDFGIEPVRKPAAPGTGA